MADDGGSICAACGLCCDGTLFVRAFVEPEERERLDRLGFPLRENDGRLVFSQPCVQLDGPCCTVYGERPAVCRAFRCRLLKRVEAGELPRAEAVATIAAGRALSDELAAMIPPGSTLPEERLRWQERERRREAGEPVEPADPALTLAQFRLNLLLDREFRSAGQRLLQVGEDPETMAGRPEGTAPTGPRAPTPGDS